MRRGIVDALSLAALLAAALPVRADAPEAASPPDHSLVPLAPEAAAPPSSPFAPLAPATVEYRWTFHVPEWSTDTELVDVYVPGSRPQRLDYAMVDFTTEPRRIGAVPEFSCKYVDLWLPNQCTTRWRNVYVEVPVPVIRHDSMIIDVPRWPWEKKRVPVEVPRLAWKEATMIVSLPALATPPAGTAPSCGGAGCDARRPQ